jgi:hypothetical protein
MKHAGSVQEEAKVGVGGLKSADAVTRCLGRGPTECLRTCLGASVWGWHWWIFGKTDFILLLLLFSVVKTKPRASHMLGKYSITELHR